MTEKQSEAVYEFIKGQIQCLSPEGTFEVAEKNNPEYCRYIHKSISTVVMLDMGHYFILVFPNGKSLSIFRDGDYPRLCDANNNPIVDEFSRKPLEYASNAIAGDPLCSGKTSAQIGFMLTEIAENI